MIAAHLGKQSGFRSEVGDFGVTEFGRYLTNIYKNKYVKGDKDVILM